MTERHLALRTSDRLRHTYVVGPTGSGKSWLLARMILQDIAAGRGVIAIDVKGDLLRDVAARVDAANHDRLIVIEPSRRDRPIGLNILAHAKSEEARELIVDNVLHIFREIWSSSWGPRTDAVLRATLRTLVEARAQDGSAYTLCEIVPLLTMPAFRRSVVQRSSLAPDLHAFWQRYNRMSDAERAQVVGPTLNKVEAFTSRSAIRLMLGQSTGIDLADVFRERKVVLLSLAKGQLGAETANLLGALCVATLWQSTLARSTVRPERRRAAFAYVDEAQDIVRLPVAMADMLAQARGLGLGLTLANQYVSQLPDGVRTAILSTVRSQLAFQLDLDDARLLEKRFQPLTARDLMGLLPCEIALRPCVNGQTLRPVTGQTLPLGDEVGDADAVGELSRRLYGRPRGQVEDAMHHRLQNTAQRPTLGRERRGGAA